MNELSQTLALVNERIANNQPATSINLEFNIETLVQLALAIVAAGLVIILMNKLLK